MPLNKLTVSGGNAKRLDIFLAGEFPEYSRSYFKHIIKSGLVKINGSNCLASARLKTGQEITVDFAEKINDIPPEKVDFKVVYEDADLLIVNKPSGLVVHPACGHSSGTLINGIAHYLGINNPNLPRVGLVHRLDKETSGILAVAKNERSFKSLAKQFAARAVTKIYLALCRGVIKEDEGIIDKPVGRSKLDRKKMAVVAGGRLSETSFRVLKRYNNYTLLEVMPKTGRTHQIRVHLQSIGHSIVGDKEYGYKHESSKRLMLHAYKLKITHPSTHKSVEFAAHPPADFKVEADV